MINNIGELYQEQKKLWNEENEKYFGISTLDDWDDLEKVENHLNKCCDKFWNNGTNELKKLFEKGFCKDIDKLVENGYELIFDNKNKLICLFGNFEYEVNFVDEQKENQVKIEKKRSPLAYLPYCNDLCMFLSGTEYALRINAYINYSLLTRIGNVVKYQKTWKYFIDEDRFEINENKVDYEPYRDLTQINIDFLETCLGNKKLTEDNFKEAMRAIPEYNKNSILYFRFEHLSEIFKMVAFSKRFANPLLRVPIPINVVKMFSSQKMGAANDTDDSAFSNLVLTTNKLFSLENVRTILYKSNYNSSFAFSDCGQFFDAFKTSTNKSAGRSRLILDDVYVMNKRLYKKDHKTGELVDMFNIIINNKIEDKNNLSVISCSRFSSNNDSKRIMMTAKLRAQAINTDGEIDNFTHETPARIVFGDFEGFNVGDGIIISKSFAKKLNNTRTIHRYIDKIDTYNFINDKYKIGDIIDTNDLIEITDTFVYDNLRNIKLVNLTRDSYTLKANAPFSVGDKITNLHGSKGIVVLILPDEDMPILENDLGPNMPAGPMDIIVSALSVYKRKSLGQIFEAWANATGHDDVNNIQDAVDLYSDEMKEYSEKSIISFRGTKTIKPCGINMIIRLNHDSIAQQSRSPIKTNYGKMLKFGEMELLNLAARNFNNIMNELDIRSVNKHIDSYHQIKDMQKTGKIDNEIVDNLRFFNILKTICIDFDIKDNNGNSFNINNINNNINNTLNGEIIDNIEIKNEKDKDSKTDNNNNKNDIVMEISTRKRSNTKRNRSIIMPTSNIVTDDIVDLFKENSDESKPKRRRRKPQIVMSSNNN